MKLTDGNQKMSEDQCLFQLNEENVNELEYQLNDASDLPTSLIVTNIDMRIFTACDLRNNFEETFKKFEENVTFQYFKSFRRVRVNFENALSAARARIQCHQMRFGDDHINCYFAGPTLTSTKTDSNSDGVYLHPPAPVKQFLISPPASPPVGWEPVDEATPCINVELISALANLSPGEAHELHPQSESQPGIVVHICEDHESDDYKPKIKIQQTARPNTTVIHRSSSEGSEDSLCSTPP